MAVSGAPGERLSELGVPKVPAHVAVDTRFDYICEERGELDTGSRRGPCWSGAPRARLDELAMENDGVDRGGGAETVVRKGPWTMEEDLVLANYVAANGEGAWNSLARSAGLNRTGKSCRLRWLNYLRPDVRRGNITPEEHVLIVELQGRWGNRWSKIARHLPGRTDNEIKNFWRTKIQKKRGGGSGDSTAVGESQSSSNSNSVGWAGATPDYGVAAEARQQGGCVDDHQLGYAVQGGGGGACTTGRVVPPEFLQSVVAESDGFWGLEEFWPMVPSLHGDC